VSVTIVSETLGIPQYIDSDGYYRPLFPTEVYRHHRVYFVQAGDDGPVKIGFSTDTQRRLKELQTASPAPLKLLAQVIGTPAIEAFVHKVLRKKHVRGEWYAIDDDDISYALGRLFEEGLTL
jgi:hypothetical protein